MKLWILGLILTFSAMADMAHTVDLAALNSLNKSISRFETLQKQHPEHRTGMQRRLGDLRQEASKILFRIKQRDASFKGAYQAQLKGAKTAYENALKGSIKSSERGEVHYQLALVNKDMGNKKELQSHLESALKNDLYEELLALVHFEFGRYWVDSEKSAQAISHFQSAKKSPDKQVAQLAQWQLAWAFYETKQLKEALATIEGLPKDAEYKKALTLFLFDGFSQEESLKLLARENFDAQENRDLLIRLTSLHKSRGWERLNSWISVLQKNNALTEYHMEWPALAFQVEDRLESAKFPEALALLENRVIPEGERDQFIAAQKLALARIQKLETTNTASSHDKQRDLLRVILVLNPQANGLAEKIQKRLLDLEYDNYKRLALWDEKSVEPKEGRNQLWNFYAKATQLKVKNYQKAALEKIYEWEGSSDRVLNELKNSSEESLVSAYVENLYKNKKFVELQSYLQVRSKDKILSQAYRNKLANRALEVQFLQAEVVKDVKQYPKCQSLERVEMREECHLSLLSLREEQKPGSVTLEELTELKKVESAWTSKHRAWTTALRAQRFREIGWIEEAYLASQEAYSLDNQSINQKDFEAYALYREESLPIELKSKNEFVEKLSKHNKDKITSPDSYTRIVKNWKSIQQSLSSLGKELRPKARRDLETQFADWTQKLIQQMQDLPGVPDEDRKELMEPFVQSMANLKGIYEPVQGFELQKRMLNILFSKNRDREHATQLMQDKRVEELRFFLLEYPVQSQTEAQKKLALALYYLSIETPKWAYEPLMAAFEKLPLEQSVSLLPMLQKQFESRNYVEGLKSLKTWSLQQPELRSVVDKNLATQDHLILAKGGLL